MSKLSGHGSHIKRKKERYGIYNNLKGRTGANVSHGKGFDTSINKKQKINTTSSTQLEVVGVYDALSHMMQTQYLLFKRTQNQ